MADYNFNAIRHGLYAKHVVMTWENKAEFDELREGLRLEYQPDGISQNEVVENLAVLFWRKRRCALIMRLLYSETPFSRLIDEVGRTEPEAIRRHQDKQKADDARRIKRLRKSIKELGNACAELTKRPRGKQAATTVARVTLRRAEDLLHEVQKLQSAAEAALTSQANPGSIAATTLELVEKASSAEARLDTQITKQIQQLIMLKEFARLYRRPVPPLVEHHFDSPSSIVTVEAEPLKTDALAVPLANPSGRAASPGSNANDNDDDDNDNNDDDDKINPDDYDWAWEYDEDLAKRKAKRRNRNR